MNYIVETKKCEKEAYELISDLLWVRLEDIVIVYEPEFKLDKLQDKILTEYGSRPFESGIIKYIEKKSYEFNQENDIKITTENIRDYVTEDMMDEFL